MFFLTVHPPLLFKEGNMLPDNLFTPSRCDGPHAQYLNHKGSSLSSIVPSEYLKFAT